MRSPSLTTQQLTEARHLYEEAGETFKQIAGRYRICERTARNLLLSVGVQPRPRGVVAAVLPVALILDDARGGWSARQIAERYGVEHHRITALLRQHGLVRRPGQRFLDSPGPAVKARHYRMRRRPPMRVPVRSPAERRIQAWTAAEIVAVTYEIEAGRYKVVPRGVTGLEAPETIQERKERKWLALLSGRRAA